MHKKGSASRRRKARSPTPRSPSANSPIELAAAHGQWQPMPAALHVFVDDADRVYQRALAAGAKELFARRRTIRPAHRSVVDGEGNRWYIATVM